MDKMSKKQQTAARDSVTITRDDLDNIKSALRRIEWIHEMSLMTPTPSDGYMFVAADMARHIAKLLKVDKEVSIG